MQEATPLKRKLDEFGTFLAKVKDFLWLHSIWNMYQGLLVTYTSYYDNNNILLSPNI